ncbi:MAG: acyl-CoA dehydrogenase family protein, partial [Elusimicrobiales bacterium]|nr:acyl-CoA dehydrogenase family protein [Elusimicrobiales bacterium]
MASMDTLSRELMLDSLRNYAKKNLTHEFLKEMDDKNEFPTEILKQMYDQSILGVHLLLIPKEYGGISGGTFDVYRICEVLAKIDLGIATGVFATFLG